MKLFFYFIFLIRHFFSVLNKKLLEVFWAEFAIFYLTKKGANLRDPKSISFKGKCLFQVQHTNIL